MSMNKNVILTNDLIEQAVEKNSIQFTPDQYRHLVRNCGFPSPLKLYRGLGKGTEGCNPACAQDILNTAIGFFKEGCEWKEAVWNGFQENEHQIFVQSAKCVSGLLFEQMNKWYYEDLKKLKRNLKNFSGSDDTDGYIAELMKFKKRTEKFKNIKQMLIKITGTSPHSDNADKILQKSLEYLKKVKPDYPEIIECDARRIAKCKDFDSVNDELLAFYYVRIESLMHGKYPIRGGV